jgi:hypothetical protein
MDPKTLICGKVAWEFHMMRAYIGQLSWSVILTINRERHGVQKVRLLCIMLASRLRLSHDHHDA